MAPKSVNLRLEPHQYHYHAEHRDRDSSESENETVHSTYRTSVLSSRASLLPAERWTSSSDGIEFFCSVVAMVYFIFMTIFGFNISLFAYDDRVPVLNFVFSIVMYGAGIIFFIYMYFFVLYTGWMRFFRRAAAPEPDERVAIYETTVAAPLYIRLGTLVFGTVAIIFYFLEMVLFFTNNYIHTREFVVHILATVFTFQQMCFICIHPKGIVLNEPDIVTSYIFADFLAFMHTCVVELAIIGAAVMFVLWKTIHRKEYLAEDLHEQKKKKKHKGKCKLDCSESAFGIIGCIIFIVAIGVMIGIYHMLKVRDVIGYPAVILEYTDLGLFIVLIIATAIAMTRLKDNHKTKKGKQFVTFIFLANTALFFFTIYESIENGIGFLDAPDGSGQPSYAFVVHFVSPLIVFFRFHSSACLAELWEHIYGHAGHH
ncbi:hypothetical protein QR680_001724 [Steinernema hermaphroditum]|uniref:Uncharacterized protein n=1 Tax=Steinernema hermaphroditum TaxID=289476 RepID=A0AA39GZP9_9BILA|nr:hypothetical protein QR680_001724 [Steinernema hermaphroditum]